MINNTIHEVTFKALFITCLPTADSQRRGLDGSRSYSTELMLWICIFGRTGNKIGVVHYVMVNKVDTCVINSIVSIFHDLVNIN